MGYLNVEECRNLGILFIVSSIIEAVMMKGPKHII
jgi:hypothetical protein